MTRGSGLLMLPASRRLGLNKKNVLLIWAIRISTIFTTVQDEEDRKMIDSRQRVFLRPKKVELSWIQLEGAGHYLK